MCEFRHLSGRLSEATEHHAHGSSIQPFIMQANLANGFGWRSDLPIRRIREAISEIRKVKRKDAVLAADGAVLLLGKLSPSLMQVDSSSGAIGTAVNNAIATLVPIIADAPADDADRDRWMERLWQAVEDDQMPYIEMLTGYWGELCNTCAGVRMGGSVYPYRPACLVG